jgi:phenylalanyl-tRNA synthetase beta chain
MKLSINWIQDYVNLDNIDMQQLINKITTTTAEIEKIHQFEDDIIIEIDNKSLTNRPDLWCHYGMAREIAAITNTKIKSQDMINIDELLIDSLPELKVSIETTAKCHRYSALAINNIHPSPSPANISKRLSNCGIRTVNLIVDLSNYIMLDIGQPLHCFNGNASDTLEVRSLSSPIEFVTLDDVTRTLPIATQIICENSIPAAIAGIIGGKESEVKDNSSSILLEAAVFDGISIRKTSSQLSLRTDASIRYEKFLDSSITTLAIKKYISLLKAYQPAIKISSKLYDCIIKPTAPVVIELEHQYIETYLGTSMQKSTIIDLLQRLDFKVIEQEKTYIVTIPSFRATKDITSKVDLIEEILRMYGYENIKPQPYKMDIVPVVQASAKAFEYTVKDLLVQKYNFNEVNTYSWYDNNWLKKLALPADNSIKIVNSSMKQYEKLRCNIIPNLLKILYDSKKDFNNIRIFEIGRVFTKEENTICQPKFLSLASINNNETSNIKESFFYIKALCSSLIKRIKGFKVSYKALEPTLAWCNPKGFLQVYIASAEDKKEVCIGYISLLNPKISTLYHNNHNIVVMELNMDILESIPTNDIMYRPIPKYPETYIDFSILTSANMSYNDILKKVAEFKDESLIDIEYIDTYIGNPIPEKMKSTTLRLKIGSKYKTLAIDELSKLQNKFTEYIIKNNLQLR